MRLYLNTLKQIENTFGDFDISQVYGGSKDVYLRFGYWDRVDTDKLQQIVGNEVTVVEDSFWDDDCGDLFSYKLKQ